jgi:signal transduction histidine kinase
LNAVLGYAQILRRDQQFTGRQLAGLTTIQRSGEHLLTLINDVVDLAQVESGQLELHEEPIDLVACLRGVVDIIRVRAEQRALALVFEMSNLPPTVHADEKRLRQVLLNLLGNAVKFTDQGEVTLRVRTRPADAGSASRCRTRGSVSSPSISTSCSSRSSNSATCGCGAVEPGLVLRSAVNSCG